jgi:hypothetical protein
MAGMPRCRTVTIHTFRGNRSAIGRAVRKALDDELNGRGPGPSRVECLLYAGHTGVSTDEDSSIFGFNPDSGFLPLSQVMQSLRNGDSFPGIVLNDTIVFAEAQRHKLPIQTFDVILPDPGFQDFQRSMGAERMKSRYAYGFPNGDGDCNCITWLERLAMPLLTGSMDEFFSLFGFLKYPRRRFGQCL